VRLVDSTPPDEPIRLYPNGGVDQFDEWRFSGSWSGKKVIRRSSLYGMNVWLKLYVSGKRSKKTYRCRPTRWHAKLTLEYVEVEVARGRCKSLLEAARAVRALDLSGPTDELLRAFYGREQATCVFVEATRPSTWDRLMDRSYEPCLTMFGRYPDYMKLPSGLKYLVIKPGNSIHLVDRSVCGYSSTGNPEIRKEATTLNPWVPAGVDQRHDHPFPFGPS